MSTRHEFFISTHIGREYTVSRGCNAQLSDNRPKSRSKVDRTKPSKKSLASSLFKALSFHRAAAPSSSLHDRVTVPASKESKKSGQHKTPGQSRPGHPVSGAQINIIA